MLHSILPYGKQDINQADVEAISSAIVGEYLTQGPLVERFENELAQFTGMKHAVVVSNGTAALHIAGLALGLKPGDAVIVPAITFVATSNSVLYCGATPVFADIEASTGNICIESATEAYHLALKNGLKPVAIFPVHFAGLPCNPEKILNFAKKYNLKIVEDSCHAFGAKYKINSNENFVSVGKFAQMSILSFHPVKHLTTGEGGAVLTDDDDLAEKLKLFRSHGITKSKNNFKNKELSCDPNGETNLWYYEMQELGYNYRLPDLLCALGLSQIKRADLFISKRKEIAEFYLKKLTEIDGVSFFSYNDKCVESSFHLFPLLIDFKKIKKNRNEFMKKLRELGVGSQVHYIPVPKQPYYMNNPDKFLSVKITNSETIYQKELSIPMYYSLTSDNIEHVVKSIRSVID